MEDRLGMIQAQQQAESAAWHMDEIRRVLHEAQRNDVDAQNRNIAAIVDSVVQPLSERMERVRGRRRKNTVSIALIVCSF